MATVDAGVVTIRTRSGKDWTDRFPTVALALAHVRVKTGVFDGEIAYVLDDGRTDFQHLQNALKGSSDLGRLVYFVFDLLHYDGSDLRGESLKRRKDILRTILADVKPPLKFGDHLRGDGKAFFDKVCELGLEGIIAKRADRPYEGGRSLDWVKVKCGQRQELVIVGSTLPKGRRVGIGALLLAVRDGNTYRYVGKVGTGFSQASLTDLSKRLAPLRVSKPAVEGAPTMRDAQWARPDLVCQVRFTEWTQGGALRHPTFEGLREDKTATAVVRESATSTAEVTHEPPRLTRLGKTKLTHGERVVDSETGITKADMARYVAVIAPHFLPFAAKRPLMLLRCMSAWPSSSASFGTPGRVPVKGRPYFVQKHAGVGLTDIGIENVHGDEVIYVTKREELYGLVQLNAFELHGWGSRLPKIEHPDWIVFDLDPDVGLPFARVVDAAFELREELAKMDLASFVKTTGGKGLHIQIGRYSAGAGTFCNDRRELRVTSSLGFRLDRLRYLFAAQHEEDGIHRVAIRNAWIVATERVSLPGRDQRLKLPPQHLRNSPTIVALDKPHREVRHSSRSPWKEDSCILHHLGGKWTYMEHMGLPAYRDRF